MSSVAPDPALTKIAEVFVTARRSGTALRDFPGAIPSDLATAYAIQDAAIGAWSGEVVGWKIGYISPEHRDGSGDERLMGPVWSSLLTTAADPGPAKIFDGGFGAVEAEYVIHLEADVPARESWTPEEALAHPATLHVGLEVASSPLATINTLGPMVTVSDFGNNHGLVVGAEISNWRTRVETLRSETEVDKVVVGSGGTHRLPGGLGASLAFIFRRATARGISLSAGQYLATGASTGIHEVTAGQDVVVRFLGESEIAVRTMFV